MGLLLMERIAPLHPRDLIHAQSFISVMGYLRRPDLGLAMQEKNTVAKKGKST